MAQGTRLATAVIEKVAHAWRTFWRDLFDPYRPELHYMRGPGPKWREKHGIAAEPTELPKATPATA